ncbi:hypothetical protein RMATCC62417_17934 [Rhizopus microsporus]|nr:hypothetical protein RMATCC62417_17934 [Rhizopus microsporus]
MLSRFCKSWPQTALLVRRSYRPRFQSFVTEVVHDKTAIKAISTKTLDQSTTTTTKSANIPEQVNTDNTNSSTLEDADKWTWYNKQKQDSRTITPEEFIDTGVYIIKSRTSNTMTVARLQALLRDVNIQIQTTQDPELVKAFLKICNMLLSAYVRTKNIKDAKLVFDGLVASPFWEGNEEITTVSVVTLMYGILENGTRSDFYKFINSVSKQNKLPCTERVYRELLYILNQYRDVNACRHYFKIMKEKGLLVHEPPYKPMFQALTIENNSEEALELLQEMKGKGIQPTTGVYCMVLRMLHDNKRNSKENKKRMEQVYQKMLDSGVELNVAVYISMGWDPLDALDELKKRSSAPIPSRDYNTCLSRLIRANRIQDALQLYRNMIKEGAAIDQYTYSMIMDAAAKDNEQPPEAVYEMYEEMKQQGLQLDEVAYTIVLGACAKEKNLTRAIRYIEEMIHYGIHPNQKNMNAFLAVVATSSSTSFNPRKLRDVWLALVSMGLQPDTRSFNVYFSALYKQMQLWKARGRSYYANESQEDNYGNPTRGPCRYMVMGYRAMKERGPSSKPDFATYTILIKGLASGGFTRLAMQIYEDAKNERVYLDVTAFNELIMALDKKGDLSDIMSIWYDMKILNVPPDNTTYDLVMDTCEKLGLHETFLNIRSQRKNDFDRLWNKSKNK